MNTIQDTNRKGSVQISYPGEPFHADTVELRFCQMTSQNDCRIVTRRVWGYEQALELVGAWLRGEEIPVT